MYKNMMKIFFCNWSLGGDRDSHHSLNVDYTLVLPSIFNLHVSNFYLSLASERDRKKILAVVRALIQPHHRIFIGVIDPLDARVETAEQVRDRILEAVRFIPAEQLGTTDDCGYAPFSDDESTTRAKCFDKIRARIDGTRMAEKILNARKWIRSNQTCSLDFFQTLHRSFSNKTKSKSIVSFQDFDQVCHRWFSCSFLNNTEY